MTKKQKFFRVGTHKYSKLGVKRKKKQKYRKPNGPDNKIRLNNKGRLRKVKIGFKNENVKRGLIKGMMPVRIFNIKDLNKIKSGMIGIVGHIGLKRKKEIAEHVLRNKVNLLNFDAQKILKMVENKIRKSKEEKDKKIDEKKVKEEKDKKIDEKKVKEEKESEIKKSKEEKDKKTEEKLEERIDEKIDEKVQEVKNESK